MPSQEPPHRVRQEPALGQGWASCWDTAAPRCAPPHRPEGAPEAAWSPGPVPGAVLTLLKTQISPFTVGRGTPWPL